MMVSLVAFAATSWAGTCAEPASEDDLRREIYSAETSFSSLDIDGFHKGIDAVDAVLACVNKPLTPSAVARLHRIEGVRKFVDRDPGSAAQAFAAARAAEPDLELPTSLVPAGHTMHALYTQVDTTSGHFVKADRPKDGKLYFDGTETLTRPIDWPTVVQVMDDSGTVTSTRWLAAADPMPTYAVGIQPTRLVAPSVASVAALGFGIGGAIEYAAARKSYDTYRFDIADDSEAETYFQKEVKPKRGLAVGLGALALVSAGAAGGLWFSVDLTDGAAMQLGGRF